jgi:outer membrane protein
LVKNKYLRLCAFLLVVFASAGAAAEIKIAVLDTQRALAESEEAKALLQKAQTELQKENDELQALVAEVEGLRDKLQKDGQVMSAAEQRNVQKDIEDKQIELQFLNNRLQKEANDRRNELLQVMVPKVQAVLKDLIAVEGYDFIMERASLGALGYANSKHDNTRRVTEKLNEKR